MGEMKWWAMSLNAFPSRQNHRHRFSFKWSSQATILVSEACVKHLNRKRGKRVIQFQMHE